jgi:hypothetical protein
MRIWIPVLAATLAACGGDGSSSPPAQALEDTTPPVITLSGANPQIIEAGEPYVELGATATDNLDGDVSGSIVIDASAVDTAVPGEYPVTYDVSDVAGNAATTVIRTVICQDTTAPVITLTGANPQSLSQGDAYAELGATAMDTVDGDLTAMLIIDASAVDTAAPGDYTVTYDVSDAAGNAAVTLTRTVRVVLAVPAVPKVSVAADIKQLIFSWDAIPYADYYRLLENPDGSSGFTQVGNDLPAGTTSVTIPVAVHLLDWVNAEYVVEACNGAGCNSSEWINAEHLMLNAIGVYQITEIEEFDGFGGSVSLSSDGLTLAVGAPWEDSSATGINGVPTDNSAEESGAVYLYRFDGSAWSKEAYIKASNTEAGDNFGFSVSLSANGNLLAVGAPREDGASKGLDGDQDDNTARNSGAVYVFGFDDFSWAQQTYIKASNTGGEWSLPGAGNEPIYFPGDFFGGSVQLCADGHTLVVAAPWEGSLADGINGAQDNNDGEYVGAVYVFRRDKLGWYQQAYIKASNSDSYDVFGASLAISDNGNTLVVGAEGEESSATGIDGDQSDNTAYASGAAYVFRFDGTGWFQQVFLKASNSEEYDNFGNSMALSSDGNVLAVGSWHEDSAATGINGDQDDNSSEHTGAAYVFKFEDNIWYQQAYVKAATEASLFARSMSLNSAGDLLVVWHRRMAGFANDFISIFRFDTESWYQHSTVDYDHFRGDFDLSSDGSVLATARFYDELGGVIYIY